MNYKKHLKYVMSASAVVLLALMVSCGNTNNPNHGDAPASAAQPNTTPPSATQTPPPPPPASAEPAQSIPDFTFYMLESGIRFTKEDLAKNGKNIVFMLFDPSCGHCQDEARELGQHYERIKDINVYFVSMNDPALMSTFLTTHAKQLVKKDNITVLYDRNTDFINRFHIPRQYPANYVYGADGLLKQYWVGTKNIEEVVEAFTQ